MTLGTALDFDEHDLAANRDSRLTRRQRNSVYFWQRALIFVLIAITVVIGIAAAIVIAAVLVGAEVSATGVLLALGSEVFTAGLAFVTWLLGQRFKRLLEPGPVQRVSGPITCYVVRERQAEPVRGQPAARPRAYIQIDDLEFKVSDAVIGAFEDGARYNLYYVLHPLRLLAGETDSVNNEKAI